MKLKTSFGRTNSKMQFGLSMNVFARKLYYYYQQQRKAHEKRTHTSFTNTKQQQIYTSKRITLDSKNIDSSV